MSWEEAIKLTTVSVLPPAAPLFVPGAHASSLQSVYCGQPAPSAVELATPALALVSVVAVGQWLDK